MIQRLHRAGEWLGLVAGEREPPLLAVREAHRFLGVVWSAIGMTAEVWPSWR